MMHIEFDLNYIEILKAIGYILAGMFTLICIILFLFNDFRIY